MLLAVDSSTAQTGLALGDGSKLAAESIWYSRFHHTIELAPALEELLRNAGATVGDIEAIAVAIGPGSFTALRVGLALVKGLALARNLPIVGVPTLDVLAAGQPASSLPLAAVLQAGRGRIALGWYRPAGPKPENKAASVGGADFPWEAQGEAEITTVDALAKSIEKPTLAAGELTLEERQRLARKKVNVVLAPPYLCVRRPSVLLAIGWARYKSGQVNDTAALAPIYLHLNDPIPA
jgi:tRNA threonylcarbamoyladenosine biosynthesis protein TsaB